MNADSIQIHLNSKFATSYNNLHMSDCTFQLPVIEAQSGHTILLSVLHTIIPYSFYSVNSSNNMLYYTEYLAIPPVSTTVYITPGNYTAYQLVAYLTNALPRTIVTYDSIINKITFTNSINNFKILSAYSTCHNLLGLANNDLYNTSVGNYLTMPGQLNLAQTKLINVVSNFSSCCISNIENNEHDILCCVPVNTNPYSLIQYTNYNNFKINLNTNNINFINIKLMNQDGNSLELNQQYFSITLQLDIVNFTE